MTSAFEMKKRVSCYSFKCLRIFLTFFNILLFALGLLIATLPIYFHIQKMVQSWPINGGIIAMGSFLVLLSLIGCYATCRQNQIILFFYMVVLAIICIITFAFSLAALSITKSQQDQVLSKGWGGLSNSTKAEIQKLGNCCGLQNGSSASHPSCESLACAATGCKSCGEVMKNEWFLGFRRSVGGVALFVSCLMAISIYLTAKYRHTKNPTADPNEYL